MIVRRSLPAVRVIASLFLAACDVGSALPPGGSQPDGGTGGSGCVNAISPPRTGHVHAAGGTSNAGQACLLSGCHLATSLGVGALPHDFMGTLYTGSDGTTTVPGATVEIMTGGATLTATTDADGNFYASGNLTFPATTLATSCPSLRSMVGQLQTGGGNCNNCHRTGAGAVTAPIFLQ